MKPLDFHPAVAHVLRYFAFEHLPERLQEVSQPFAALAFQIAQRAESSPETTVALRKLLEAKDAAVRAALDVPAAVLDYVRARGLYQGGDSG